MFRDELAEFRKLHAAAGPRGQLSPQEEARYASLSALLFRSVLAAQNESLGARHVPRSGIRLRRAMQVELSWGQDKHRALTLDVGTGGFAALVGSAPPMSAPVRVRLQLSQVESITSTAHVAGTRQRRGTARVSFAFTELTEPERTRLERCLLDGALSEFALAAMHQTG